MADFENACNRLEPAGQRAYSEMVLTALREQRRTDSYNWLSDLAREVEPLATSSEPDTADGAAYMFTFIERLFDDFDRYAADFNSRVGGTDLIVSTSRPSHDPTIGADAIAPMSESYSGHISTRFWAMVFAVEQRRVDVYIIPAEVLLAFKAGTEKAGGYQPFMTLFGVSQPNHYYWQLGNKALYESGLPALAKELFKDLVQVACGKLSEDELASPLVAEALEPISFQPEPLPNMVPEACASAEFWQRADLFSDAINNELARLSIAATMAACMEHGAAKSVVLRHANSFQTLAGVAPQRPDNAVGYAAVVMG